MSWCNAVKLVLLVADMDGFKLLEVVGLELGLPVISECRCPCTSSNWLWIHEVYCPVDHSISSWLSCSSVSRDM